MQNKNIKTIYLAGGCFWGLEAYFSKINGIVNTKVGYANGNTNSPSYEEVCTDETGFAEAVCVEYDCKKITLSNILEMFFEIIDPTAKNRQSYDIGSQYRSGIYYVDDDDLADIETVVSYVQSNYQVPLAVEVEKLRNFYPAEDYHQKYLDKNPGGYCHIDLSRVKKYQKPADDVLREKLSDIQYAVTQNSATEKPYTSPYNKNFEEGIYVDIVTGEPLFSSKDKFNSSCGWPSFSKPIRKSALRASLDDSLGMERIELKSRVGGSHLGHVFEDGPADKGGLRYCINGAALKFIPVKDLLNEGYGEYLALFKNN